MFTPKELNAIDHSYFSIIAANGSSSRKIPATAGISF